MSNPPAPRQARNDERDYSRVFGFLFVAAAVVFLGALLYFFAVDKLINAAGPTVGPPSAQVQDAAAGSGPGAAQGSSASPDAPAR